MAPKIYQVRKYEKVIVCEANESVDCLREKEAEGTKRRIRRRAGNQPDRKKCVETGQAATDKGDCAV